MQEMIERILAWAKAMKISKGSYSDVIELSTLLQCLGFSVKSLQFIDGNASQDAGASRTVVIDCPTSGYHMVLENTVASCTCPAPSDQRSWSVTGVAQGKTMTEEIGLLTMVPTKAQRDRVSEELRQVLRGVMESNESTAASQLELSKSVSTSNLEMTSPEKRDFHLKVESPMRYRSLDTLTRPSMVEDLPLPGPLTKAGEMETKARRMCRRQDTYTIRRPRSTSSFNKTSSPIKSSLTNLLENLMEADRAAEEIREKLALAISELQEPRVDPDDSIASLALDVSKISLLKGQEPSKCQFVSSPNLSLITRGESRTSLKRTESSASTSNLAAPGEQKFKSKLRRLSPNFFKGKSASPSIAPTNDSKSKLHNIFKQKAKIVKPVSIPVRKESYTSLANLSSASKNKYSHVKSTIPRATPSPNLPRKAPPSPNLPRKAPPSPNLPRKAV